MKKKIMIRTFQASVVILGIFLTKLMASTESAILKYNIWELI